MDKLWTGRFSKELDERANAFNASLPFDCRMVRQDIAGSVVHAKMLCKCGIISERDCIAITDGLSAIADEIENGKLKIENSEDIHSFIEGELTARIGEAGKRLHTARSRNDQVALDLRLYAREKAGVIQAGIKGVLEALYTIAAQNTTTVLPGYTHLQRAQPITFAHHLLAYTAMLRRDYERIQDAVRRMMAECPIGCCALAGTTYPTDRGFEAEQLGFTGISNNSLDGVSDRDYCIELLSALATVMMHLSRLSEEIILWSSLEFGYVELDDAFTTGSSIMPQKKNSDMAELIRGKTGRVYGDLMGMLTVMKGIPLAYNKDMQEDKEGLFDAFDTVENCLVIAAPMIASMKVKPEKMLRAAGEGFINATDLADYLTKKGRPFRAAYKTVGQIVGYCIEKGKILETVTLEEYKSFDDCFTSDLYDAIALQTCVEKRCSAGSTGPQSVAYQLKRLREFLA